MIIPNLQSINPKRGFWRKIFATYLSQDGHGGGMFALISVPKKEGTPDVSGVPK
jgi:hypothetical protein